MTKTIAEPWESLFPPGVYAEMIEWLWLNTPKLEMYYEPKKDPEQALAHIEKRQGRRLGSLAATIGCSLTSPTRRRGRS